VRLRTKPAPADTSKALSRDRVAEILGSDAALRDRVLWHIPLRVVTRKGGARDLIAWQTGAARLLPRLLAGRRSGPVFLTDRKACPSVARHDIDPSTGRARISYRRAAELFEAHTDHYDDGPYTLHQLRHSRLTHAAEKGRPRRS